jgi:hypothetical protein
MDRQRPSVLEHGYVAPWTEYGGTGAAPLLLCCFVWSSLTLLELALHREGSTEL